MTDKEKKSKIADILMDFQEEYSNEVVNRPMLASLYAGNILSFIDSLQEEPVSKDFEMALAEMVDKAQKCVVEPWVAAAQWKDYLIKLAKSEEPVSKELKEAAIEAFKQIVDSDKNSFLEIFKAGAKWKKKQMMAKVIDATCFGFQGAALFTFRLPAGSYLVGSKVKVIVINED